jgi:zinc transport system substrate-binding protein
MKFNTLLISSVLTSILILAGCGISKSANTEEKTERETLTVYTTIYPLEDFTEKIGGKFVNVKSIYPPNVDAHDFEPSTKDMISLAESDLFIYTGVGIDGFAQKAAEALKKENVTILEAGEGIELIKFTEEEEEHHHEADSTEANDHEHEEDEHEHGDYDPHIWLDPNLSINLAENIKNGLIDSMPEHASVFKSNFNKLKTDLEKLDQEYQTTIENSKTKYILVAHAAYGYWEHRYGIEQIAISGLSPTQESTQKELQNIIE